MEAVESHHAEIFEAADIVACFESLPHADRATALSDFATDRTDAPDAHMPIAWVRARRLVDDRLLWVPFDVVSLDCAGGPDGRFDKSSVGLAAHHDLRAAMLTAIFEVIERDAEWVWRMQPIARRSRRRLDAGTAPFGWFQRLRARIERQGVRLTLYEIPAVIAVPVFICELIEPGAGGAARHIVYGSAAHVLPEQALLRSVVEAVQSRVTLIAGVRDDIYYRDPAPGGAETIGLGLPLPPGLVMRTWADVEAAFGAPAEPDPIDLAARLAAAGYRDTAIVDLSRPEMEAVVVKAVSPGLASFARVRRPAGRAA
jgi:ribosomal protein S12 methylthiotransferase accessory factor